MEGLGSTYTIHLRLPGKCIVNFLFVLIELVSLAVMVEVLQANIESEQSHGLLATAQHFMLVHQKVRSGLPISVY